MNFFFADFVVVGYCVLQSQQKRNVPARSEFIEKILKRKKSISVRSSGYGSSRTCYGWPLNFFVINECKNDITRFVSITRVNAIIFISSSLLLSLPPLSSSSLSLLSLSDKGSFSASPQFLSILLVADQFLQDSFWRSQCLVRCFSSLWCLRYLFSSGTPSFFSFVGSSKNLSKHNPHNFFSVAFWFPFSLSSALFFLKPNTSRCVRYKQKTFA